MPQTLRTQLEARKQERLRRLVGAPEPPQVDPQVEPARVAGVRHPGARTQPGGERQPQTPNDWFRSELEAMRGRPGAGGSPRW